MRTLSIFSCINSFRTYAVVTGVCKPVAQWLQGVCMIDNHYHINTINQKLETPHTWSGTGASNVQLYTPMLILVVIGHDTDVLVILIRAAIIFCFIGLSVFAIMVTDTLQMKVWRIHFTYMYVYYEAASVGSTLVLFKWWIHHGMLLEFPLYIINPLSTCMVNATQKIIIN